MYSAAKRFRLPVDSGIQVGGSLCSAKPRLVLPVTLCFGHVSHSLHALVDSGAEQNLTDAALAERLHLPLEAVDPPILL